MPSTHNEIKTGKTKIQEVFSDWYTVPSYQRPYVWTKDEISDLLDDISYAAENTPHDDYFLGSYVYQHKPATKQGDFVENDLLDGQQRITTLFLLFAVIRDTTPVAKRKEKCQAYIFQEKDPDTNTPERIRLLYKIRPEVENFIIEYIKPDGSIIKHFEDFKKRALNENDTTIRNICAAIVTIRQFFDENQNADVFFPYLLQYVVMIFVHSEQLEDAFRLFTILNDRGVKLRNSDILKAQNLQKLDSESNKLKWGKKWEDWEAALGDDFDRFLSFIRTIIVKEKARLSLLNEFEENIYRSRRQLNDTKKTPLLEKGKDTFTLIDRYYKNYDLLFEGNTFSFTNSHHLHNLLICMQQTLPSTDWIPPLLRYYDKFGETKILDFLKKLDNKFSGDWICQYTPTERIEGMNMVLRGIDAAKNPEELFKTKLFDVLLKNILQTLAGWIYGKQITKYILLKLDYIFNDNAVTKWNPFTHITVEHILPQNPSHTSQWVKDFDASDRLTYTNKFGNLILLGRGKNASLGRLDFWQKHQRYFAENINTFPNSIRVFQKYQTVWTKAEVEENQKFVLKTIEQYYS